MINSACSCWFKQTKWLVNKYFVKITAYNKLVAEVNNIDTSGFVLKTKYDTDKSEIENKIPDTISLLRRQITMLKLLKQRVKYQVFVV